MEIITTVTSWVLISLGSFFLVAGAIGLLRMPDLYTRMHAVSVMETLGATLLVLGLMVQAGLSLVTLKLLFILALFFFFSPVASHALAQAALHAGLKPILAEDRRDRDLPPAGPVAGAPAGNESSGDGAGAQS